MLCGARLRPQRIAPNCAQLPAIAPELRAAHAERKHTIGDRRLRVGADRLAAVGDELRDRRVGEADEGRHRAGAGAMRLHRLLHPVGARDRELEAVLEREAPRVHQRRELAHAVAGERAALRDRLGLEPRHLVRAGERDDERARLRVPRLHQPRVRPLEAQAQHVVAEDGRRAREEAGDARHVDEPPAHPREDAAAPAEEHRAARPLLRDVHPRRRLELVERGRCAVVRAVRRAVPEERREAVLGVEHRVDVGVARVGQLREGGGGGEPHVERREAVPRNSQRIATRERRSQPKFDSFFTFTGPHPRLR